MDVENDIFDKMKEWEYEFNARKQFGDFISSINEEERLMKESKKIYDIIDSIVLGNESSKFIKVLQNKCSYYRARIISTADYSKANTGIDMDIYGKLHGYNEDNSREPIIGISSSGRNNIAGESYLYVASNEETACIEVKPQYGDLISLATFDFRQDTRIIDFSKDIKFNREDTEIHNMSLGIFFTQLMSQFSIPIKNNNVYRATQIISDYLRKTGIDGIAYKSFFTPNGVNYCFFNCHREKVKYVDSRILLYKYANHSFWDFNNKKAILTCTDENLKYKEEIAEKHLKDFNTLLKKHG